MATNMKNSIDLPVVKTDIFRDIQNQFAVGIVANGNDIVDRHSSIFEGAAALRAQVYVGKGYITEDMLDANGLELNADDGRSVHFATVERIATGGLARVVACMRLIVKEASDQALPVEELFPELFVGNPAVVGSTEVSRLISRHEDPMLQSLVKWPMFRAGLEHVQRNNLGPAYGVVPAILATSLTSQQVPIDILGEPRYLERINATKQPIRVNLGELGTVVSQLNFQNIPLGEGVFSYASFDDVDGLLSQSDGL